MKDRVTAVIPTYTNDQGLKLVVGQLMEAKIPVVMVDNRPGGEKRWLAENADAVYLPQKKNLGFARAVNVGVKEAKTEWVMVLNDDVEFPADIGVIGLIGKAEEQGWVAVSLILKRPVSTEFSGPARSHSERSEESIPQDSEIENIGYTVLPIGKVELNFDPEKNTSEDLDGLTAACLLIKREVFEELGGFDEAFFAYLEDVDLFLRLKEKGYAFGVATDIEVIHRHQQTSKHNPKKKAYLDMVNWWRVVMKHPTKFLLSPTLPHMLVERGRNVCGYLRVMLK